MTELIVTKIEDEDVFEQWVKIECGLCYTEEFIEPDCATLRNLYDWGYRAVETDDTVYSIACADCVKDVKRDIGE